MPAKRVDMSMTKDPEVEPEPDTLDPDDGAKENPAVESPEIGEFVEEEDQYDRPYMVEDMDPDTPLFKDGPTAAEVMDWKKAFDEVYFTSLSMDDHVIWRCLGRGEWRNIERIFEEAVENGQPPTEAMMDKQEAVTQLCTLYPQMTRAKMQRIKAGVPALIYQQVLEASGFVALDVRQL